MKRVILTIVYGLLLTGYTFSQADSQPTAIVNLIKSEIITVGQLKAEVQRMEMASGQRLTVPERRETLDQMINERLVIQAAERDRVTVTEHEVNQGIQQLRNNLAQLLGRQPTDIEFNLSIRNETGLEPTVFREQLRKQIIVQKYLFTQKEALFNSIRIPTEAEIQAQYNLSRSQLVQPETIRFLTILVPYGPDATSRTRARELAESLAREIGNNSSRYDEVALRSRSPNSGFFAGDGGFLPRNDEGLAAVGIDFINTAFSLRQGEVSRLIEGRAGFHIIKVTENYSAKTLELDDIYTLGSSTTVREFISQIMLLERQQSISAQATQELIAELGAAANIQVFDSNLNW